MGVVFLVVGIKRTLAECRRGRHGPEVVDDDQAGLSDMGDNEYEARALGLDRDNTFVRRRLAQKLTFLVEDTTRIGDPDEVELQKYLAANAERYRSEPRISFSAGLLQRETPDRRRGRRKGRAWDHLGERYPARRSTAPRCQLFPG
jgi:hypothetical protein